MVSNIRSSNFAPTILTKMSSEALTTIPLTSLPRLSQGKVRYGICVSEPAPLSDKEDLPSTDQFFTMNFRQC